MKQKTAVLALVGIFLLLSGSIADEKQDQADDALAKSLKDADVIFTGKIGKVNPLGQTNSIPPSTFGEITFKDGKALRGAVPEAKLNYSTREGKVNFDMDAKGEVLVAVKKTGVMAIVPATDGNLAIAKKIIAEAKEKD